MSVAEKEEAATMALEHTIHTGSLHNLAALMTASGIKPSRIRKQLKLSKEKYAIFLRSGVFQVLVAEYRKKMLEQGIADASTALLGDALTNVQFLKDARDGKYDKDLDPAKMGNRLRASKMLLDNQFPKGDEGPSVQRMNDALRAIANAVCAEAGEPIEIEAINIDDAIAKMEEQES